MYAVAAAAVQVTVGGRVHLCAHGSRLPEGVSEETIEGLLRKGLIETVEVEATEEVEESEAVEEGVYKGVKVADLKAEIEKRNSDREDAAKIIPAEPGNRPQIVAALIADDNNQ